MITKKQLCEAKLREIAQHEFGMKRPIDITKISETIAFRSSPAGVCMEYLGLIKDPAIDQYVSSRGGLLILSHDENGEPVTISFRDVLESMKE